MDASWQTDGCAHSWAESEKLPRGRITCAYREIGLGRYRRANKIVLILDNYRIHKSQLVERWLQDNLLFQPVYHPWVNVIERLWKAMHDTVTRNHRCRSMLELCQHVARFLCVGTYLNTYL